MRKALAGIALTATFTALAAPAAHACSCMPCDFQPPILEADYFSAFVGELVSVRKPLSGSFAAGSEDGFEYPEELIYLFKVTRSVKGDMPKYVMVRSAVSSAACGVTFSFESLNAVAVTQDADGRYRSGMCSQMCWGSEVNRGAITEDTMQTYVEPGREE